MFRHEGAGRRHVLYVGGASPSVRSPWAAGDQLQRRSGRCAGGGGRTHHDHQYPWGGPSAPGTAAAVTLRVSPLCGGYVRLDKDGRSYLFNTGDGSLFGEEYLDVGDFTGNYGGACAREEWLGICGTTIFSLSWTASFRRQAPFLLPNNQAVVQWADGTFSTIEPDGQKGTLDSGWTYLSDFNQQRYALGVRADEDGALQATLVSFFQNVALPGKIEEYVLYGATGGAQRRRNVHPL